MKPKLNNLRGNVRETILYLVFGALTTVISIVLYWFFTRIVQVGYYVANVLSWFGAVTFAYITNKQIVFSDKGNLVKKAFAFYLSRLFSLAVESGVMYLMIECLSVNDLITKIVVQVIVIVLNYIVSKFMIFKKGK